MPFIPTASCGVFVGVLDKTVHTYDENLADEVYAALPQIAESFYALLKSLKKEV